MLQCVDGGTIWSQRSETYTQVVGLAQVDDSMTVLPIGDHVGPEPDEPDASASPWWDARAQLWASGQLEPAPLSAGAVDALATDAEVLAYEPED